MNWCIDIIPAQSFPVSLIFWIKIACPCDVRMAESVTSFFTFQIPYFGRPVSVDFFYLALSENIGFIERRSGIRLISISKQPFISVVPMQY